MNDQRIFGFGDCARFAVVRDAKRWLVPLYKFCCVNIWCILTKASADARKGETSIGCRSKLSAKHKAVNDAQGAISQLQHIHATTNVQSWLPKRRIELVESVAIRLLHAHVNTIGFNFSCVLLLPSFPLFISASATELCGRPASRLSLPLVAGRIKYFAPSRCS